jgi:hypothetical protein
MALKDMACMNVVSIGTGTITLNDAVPGFQTFAAAGATNNEVMSYGVQDIAAGWEVGRGTYITNSTGNFLERSVFYSSNDNNPISMTLAANVSITVLLEDFNTLIPANSISVGNSTSNIAANSTVLSIGGNANTFMNSSSLMIAGVFDPIFDEVHRLYGGI